MPDVDTFLEEAAHELRRRLPHIDDEDARGPMEDTIGLLTDYRLSGMDAAAFARLLATLGAGRSPVGLAVAAPQTIARDLAARWRAYQAQERTPAPMRRVPALT
jgi:hypothetical protein